MSLPNQIHPFHVVGAGSQYQVARSLRFRASNSAYLSRTPASAGNRKTFTISFWTKRGDIATTPQYIFGAGAGITESTWFAIAFDTVTATQQVGSGSWTTSGGYTNASLRDPNAWYHIVVAVDTTQATALNRSKLYINGVLQTYTGSVTLTQNADLAWNNNVLHYIGARIDSGPRMYYDGYIAEINSIDGQQLDPTYFGQYDSNSVWQPKKYTGTYGTNGFYLPFSDNSGATSTTIGKDNSGNGNNWTPSGISVIAGTTNDSLVDSPTNYGVDTGIGGEVRGNYATLNPNIPSSSSYISRGNLYASGTAAFVRSTMSVPATGQFYYEVYVTAAGSGGYLYGGPYALYKQDGTRFNGSSFVSYGASYTAGDTIGCAIDTTNNTVTWYKNNTSQGTITTNVGLSRDGLSDIVGFDGGGLTWTVDFNFGQRPFTYTAPSGFKALCTQNLPTPIIG